MIRKKTVVVVAAGASNDLNLPLGKGLQERVSGLLAETGDIWRYLNSASLEYFGPTEKDRAQSVAERARQQRLQILQSSSIDNFLNQFKNDPDLVSFLKMVIAYALAEAEQKSLISGRKPDTDIITNTSDYFLHDFMNIVVRGHQKDNIEESLANLTFVIFNYDRCVERYLELWMKFRFGVDFDWHGGVTKFIHVYGSLGDYYDRATFNPFEYDGNFAFQNPHQELPRYVDRIKTFTEEAASEVRNEIETSIDEAETVIFLGFGFEEQNMKYFDGKWSNKRVFATVFGMSPQNGAFIGEALTKRFSNIGRLVYTVDGKSRKLITDLYHPLTAAVGSL